MEMEYCVYVCEREKDIARYEQGYKWHEFVGKKQNDNC